MHSGGIWNNSELQGEKMRKLWDRPTSSWKNENAGDCCILKLFETILWNRSENFESNEQNGAICRYLIQYFDLRKKFESNGSKWCILTLFETFLDPLVLRPFNLGPGPTGPIGATPVLVYYYYMYHHIYESKQHYNKLDKVSVILNCKCCPFNSTKWTCVHISFTNTVNINGRCVSLWQ